MDADAVRRYSLSPRRRSTRDTSEGPRFFEMASSSQPFPVARLLDRITSLQNDLKQERQKRNDECKELRERHENHLEHLQRVKDDCEGKLAQLQERYRDDVDHLREKAERMEENWTALDVLARSLRSEVYGLRASSSVNQRTSDPSSQTEPDSNLLNAVTGMTTELEQWRTRGFGSSERTNTNESDNHNIALQKASETWQEERCKLLGQQGKLEGTIAELQAEAKATNTFTKELQKRLHKQNSLHNDHHFDTTQVQVRRAAHAGIMKEMNKDLKILQKALQRKMQLIQNAIDIDIPQEPPNVREVTAKATDRNLNSAEGESTDRQAVIKVETISSPQRSNEPSIRVESAIQVRTDSSGTSAGSANTAEPSHARGLKRPWSELLEAEDNTSPSKAQRRLTGSQGCVGVSNQPWSWKPGEICTTIGIRPPLRDLSANSRPQPKFGQPAFGENVFPPLRYMSHNKDVPCTTIPHEKPTSQTQPTVVAPSDTADPAGETRETNTHSKTNQETLSKDGNPEAPSTVRIPWPAPTPGPKKWQNSVLKRNR